MKKVPLTKLKQTTWPDIRDWLRDGELVLITQHNKPLAEMYRPGIVESLKAQISSLTEKLDNAQADTDRV